MPAVVAGRAGRALVEAAAELAHADVRSRLRPARPSAGTMEISARPVGMALSSGTPLVARQPCALPVNPGLMYPTVAGERGRVLVGGPVATRRDRATVLEEPMIVTISRRSLEISAVNFLSASRRRRACRRGSRRRASCFSPLVGRGEHLPAAVARRAGRSSKRRR